MLLILTNDDGIEAPGLAALTASVAAMGQPLVVAPAEPQSGIGHRVTVRSALTLYQENSDRYRVEGTPADCARVALKLVAPNADWLIAGINPGANLGSDIYNSGTVAAAREAAILGYRAIAVSQYIAPDVTVDWPKPPPGGSVWSTPS